MASARTRPRSARSRTGRRSFSIEQFPTELDETANIHFGAVVVVAGASRRRRRALGGSRPAEVPAVDVNTPHDAVENKPGSTRCFACARSACSSLRRRSSLCFMVAARVEFFGLAFLASLGLFLRPPGQCSVLRASCRPRGARARWRRRSSRSIVGDLWFSAALSILQTSLGTVIAMLGAAVRRCAWSLALWWPRASEAGGELPKAMS